MKRIVIFIYLILTELLFVNGQQWCKEIKPAKLEDTPYSINAKLTSDRFYHTINPHITKSKSTQFEMVLYLRDEYYAINNLNENDTISIFNIYSSYKIKRAIGNRLEIHLSLNEIIFLSSDEIEKYSGDNVYSGISMGAKYLMFESPDRKNTVTLSGQFTKSKLLNRTNSSFLPEVRVLYSNIVTKYLHITGNIGVIFINKNTNSLLYSIETKWFVSKRLELLTEFFNNYTKSALLGKPYKRWLLGIGFYLHENLYAYSTFENGLDNVDPLNRGKVDIGLTYRF